MECITCYDRISMGAIIARWCPVQDDEVIYSRRNNAPKGHPRLYTSGFAACRRTPPRKCTLAYFRRSRCRTYSDEGIKWSKRGCFFIKIFCKFMFWISVVKFCQTPKQINYILYVYDTSKGLKLLIQVSFFFQVLVINELIV